MRLQPARPLSLLRRFYSSEISRGNPLRVAIVGSGPAGFYSAQYLIKNLHDAQVDMFEKYPVPFGLVRFGVAPDHPEVKNVIHSFTTTAKLENFRFLGGVCVGTTITVPELLARYHAVILAYGAGKDKFLGIPGESGANVMSAREIVGWYNGLPEDAALNPDLSSPTAVIIGQGNVAVDVARILLTPPDLLAKTDITQHALAALRKSRIRNVYLVGRRGPAQVAFTVREFRELTKLTNVNTVFSHSDLDTIRTGLGNFPRHRKRLMELALSSGERPIKADSKNCHLKFMLSPRKIVKADGVIHAVNFTVNRMEDPLDPHSAVIPTDDILTVKCGLVLRSIGYEAEPVDKSLPFDKSKHLIPNDQGRVESPAKGLYCSGWIKRGPVGVILTTMNDAYETVDSLLDDLKAGLINVEERKPSREAVVEFLRSRQCDPVTFPEWEAIDAEEMKRGEAVGKPREKLVDVRDMISVAKKVDLDLAHEEAL
ncbi:NADPH:adrenodoxin oxidoreductase, mitochondrial [Hypsibius exemplaris]|uniref:NADPH:adrenodoxin oxidoreductase, mitochondrial n=1 Tax=Hypsibius exemplaris TaxID=2072580 RepID=A0A1W0WSH6_HYPEX|nr:NADPH:adrenodoxin oxidoreductase, mitochondrial [Hypsibius exemplaris]